MPEMHTDEDRAKEAKAATVVLEDYLESDGFNRHLKQVLPAHLESDRFATIALRQLSAIPDLKKCTLASVAGAVMQAGTLGLEIATQGECWLIPREEKKGKPEARWEASLQIGYLGHLALAWRSSQIAGLACDVVCETDEFEFMKGTSGFLRHRPAAGRKRDAEHILGAWACLKTVHGGEVWDYIDKAEIERIRNSGPSANSPAWRNWYDQQAIAKVLKRTLKFCPKSRELARAIALDDLHDANIHQDFAMDIPVLPAMTPTSRKAQDVTDALRKTEKSSAPAAESTPQDADAVDVEVGQPELAPVPATKKPMGKGVGF